MGVQPEFAYPENVLQRGGGFWLKRFSLRTLIYTYRRFTPRKLLSFFIYRVSPILIITLVACLVMAVLDTFDSAWKKEVPFNTDKVLHLHFEYDCIVYLAAGPANILRFDSLGHSLNLSPDGTGRVVFADANSASTQNCKLVIQFQTDKIPFIRLTCLKSCRVIKEAGERLQFQALFSLAGGSISIENAIVGGLIAVKGGRMFLAETEFSYGFLLLHKSELTASGIYSVLRFSAIASIYQIEGETSFADGLKTLYAEVTPLPSLPASDFSKFFADAQPDFVPPFSRSFLPPDLKEAIPYRTIYAHTAKVNLNPEKEPPPQVIAERLFARRLIEGKKSDGNVEVSAICHQLEDTFSRDGIYIIEFQEDTFGKVPKGANFILYRKSFSYCKITEYINYEKNLSYSMLLNYAPSQALFLNPRYQTLSYFYFAAALKKCLSQTTNADWRLLLRVTDGPAFRASLASIDSFIFSTEQLTEDVYRAGMILRIGTIELGQLALFPFMEGQAWDKCEMLSLALIAAFFFLLWGALLIVMSAQISSYCAYTKLFGARSNAVDIKLSTFMRFFCISPNLFLDYLTLAVLHSRREPLDEFHKLVFSGGKAEPACDERPLQLKVLRRVFGHFCYANCLAARPMNYASSQEVLLRYGYTIHEADGAETRVCDLLIIYDSRKKFKEPLHSLECFISAFCFRIAGLTTKLSTFVHLYRQFCAQHKFSETCIDAAALRQCNLDTLAVKTLYIVRAENSRGSLAKYTLDRELVQSCGKKRTGKLAPQRLRRMRQQLQLRPSFKYTTAQLTLYLLMLGIVCSADLTLAAVFFPLNQFTFVYLRLFYQQFFAAPVLLQRVTLGIYHSLLLYVLVTWPWRHGSSCWPARVLWVAFWLLSYFFMAIKLYVVSRALSNYVFVIIVSNFSLGLKSVRFWMFLIIALSCAVWFAHILRRCRAIKARARRELRKSLSAKWRRELPAAPQPVQSAALFAVDYISSQQSRLSRPLAERLLLDISPQIDMQLTPACLRLVAAFSQELPPRQVCKRLAGFAFGVLLQRGDGEPEGYRPLRKYLSKVLVGQLHQQAFDRKAFVDALFLYVEPDVRAELLSEFSFATNIIFSASRSRCREGVLQHISLREGKNLPRTFLAVRVALPWRSTLDYAPLPGSPAALGAILDSLVPPSSESALLVQVFLKLHLHRRGDVDALQPDDLARLCALVRAGAELDFLTTQTLDCLFTFTHHLCGCFDRAQAFCAPVSVDEELGRFFARIGAEKSAPEGVAFNPLDVMRHNRFWEASCIALEMSGAELSGLINFVCGAPTPSIQAFLELLARRNSLPALKDFVWFLYNLINVNAKTDPLALFPYLAEITALLLPQSSQTLMPRDPARGRAATLFDTTLLCAFSACDVQKYQTWKASRAKENAALLPLLDLAFAVKCGGADYAFLKPSVFAVFKGMVAGEREALFISNVLSLLIGVKQKTKGESGEAHFKKLKVLLQDSRPALHTFLTKALHDSEEKQLEFVEQAPGFQYSETVSVLQTLRWARTACKVAYQSAAALRKLKDFLRGVIPDIDFDICFLIMQHVIARHQRGPLAAWQLTEVINCFNRNLPCGDAGSTFARFMQSLIGYALGDGGSRVCAFFQESSPFITRLLRLRLAQDPRQRRQLQTEVVMSLPSRLRDAWALASLINDAEPLELPVVADARLLLFVRTAKRDFSQLADLLRICLGASDSKLAEEFVTETIACVSAALLRHESATTGAEDLVGQIYALKRAIAAEQGQGRGAACFGGHFSALFRKLDIGETEFTSLMRCAMQTHDLKDVHTVLDLLEVRLESRSALINFALMRRRKALSANESYAYAELRPFSTIFSLSDAVAPPYVFWAVVFVMQRDFDLLAQLICAEQLCLGAEFYFNYFSVIFFFLNSEYANGEATADTAAVVNCKQSHFRAIRANRLVSSELLLACDLSAVKRRAGVPPDAIFNAQQRFSLISLAQCFAGGAGLAPDGEFIGIMLNYCACLDDCKEPKAIENGHRRLNRVKKEFINYITHNQLRFDAPQKFLLAVGEEGLLADSGFIVAANRWLLRSWLSTLDESMMALRVRVAAVLELDDTFCCFNHSLASMPPGCLRELFLSSAFYVHFLDHMLHLFAKSMQDCREACNHLSAETLFQLGCAPLPGGEAMPSLLTCVIDAILITAIKIALHLSATEAAASLEAFIHLLVRLIQGREFSLGSPITPPKLRLYWRLTDLLFLHNTAEPCWAFSAAHTAADIGLPDYFARLFPISASADAPASCAAEDAMGAAGVQQLARREIALNAFSQPRWAQVAGDLAVVSRLRRWALELTASCKAVSENISCAAAAFPDAEREDVRPFISLLFYNPEDSAQRHCLLRALRGGTCSKPQDMLDLLAFLLGRQATWPLSPPGLAREGSRGEEKRSGLVQWAAEARRQGCGPAAIRRVQAVYSLGSGHYAESSAGMEAATAFLVNLVSRVKQHTVAAFAPKVVAALARKQPVSPCEVLNFLYAESDSSFAGETAGLLDTVFNNDFGPLERPTAAQGRALLRCGLLTELSQLNVFGLLHALDQTVGSSVELNSSLRAYLSYSGHNLRGVDVHNASLQLQMANAFAWGNFAAARDVLSRLRLRREYAFVTAVMAKLNRNGEGAQSADTAAEYMLLTLLRADAKLRRQQNPSPDRLFEFTLEEKWEELADTIFYGGRKLRPQGPLLFEEEAEECQFLPALLRFRLAFHGEYGTLMRESPVSFSETESRIIETLEELQRAPGSTNDPAWVRQYKSIFCPQGQPHLNSIDTLICLHHQTESSSVPHLEGTAKLQLISSAAWLVEGDHSTHSDAVHRIFKAVFDGISQPSFNSKARTLIDFYLQCARPGIDRDVAHRLLGIDFDLITGMCAQLAAPKSKHGLSAVFPLLHTFLTELGVDKSTTISILKLLIVERLQLRPSSIFPAPLPDPLCAYNTGLRWHKEGWHVHLARTTLRSWSAWRPVTEHIRAHYPLIALSDSEFEMVFSIIYDVLFDAGRCSEYQLRKVLRHLHHTHAEEKSLVDHTVQHALSDKRCGKRGDFSLTKCAFLELNAQLYELEVLSQERTLKREEGMTPLGVLARSILLLYNIFLMLIIDSVELEFPSKRIVLMVSLLQVTAFFFLEVAYKICRDFRHK